MLSDDIKIKGSTLSININCDSGFIAILFFKIGLTLIRYLERLCRSKLFIAPICINLMGSEDMGVEKRYD